MSYYLSSICLLENQLPQGAATSPQISNIICKRLDKRLQNLSKVFSVNYTRYADDMTFSGHYISKSFQSVVKRIIYDEGFSINERKELLILGYRKKKIVTGISISNDKELKIPRAQKRGIKQDVFKFFKYNYKIDPNNEDFDPLFSDRLLGRLNFWRQVEKNNNLVNELIRKVKRKSTTYNRTLAQ